MKQFILILILILNINGYAQDNKTVTLVVSGEGKTKDEAKYNALRSAIEQAFGAFISSKTEILNDNLVKDEILSVANGNIQKYEVISEIQTPNSGYAISLKATVSITKLNSFAESKGVVVEFKGSIFAINIKQQLLNEEAEIKVVREIVQLLHEPMQTAFDYTIKSSEPRSLNAENNNWEILLQVTATANKNMDFCARYFIKTLTALSLSEEEVASYKSLNKLVYPVVVNYGNVTNTFYLRKQSSLDLLLTFLNRWVFYTRLFSVELGRIKSYNNYYKNDSIHNFSNNLNKNTGKIEINFLSSEQTAAIFSHKYQLTLNEIEQITSFKVNPKGVVSSISTDNNLILSKNELDEIFYDSEVSPKFPGGDMALGELLRKNLIYPTVARENNIQGRVVVNFVVEIDGSLTDFRVIRGIGGGCDEEAIRVLKKMPKWDPGIANGRPARISFTIPVLFSLGGY